MHESSAEAVPSGSSPALRAARAPIAVTPGRPEMEALKAAKRSMRRAAAIARAEAAERISPAEAGTRVAALVLASVPVEPGVAVSGYWPVADELDVRPLLGRLHAAGHAIGLPVVEARGEPLRFRRWEPGAPLVAAEYGIHVPGPTAPEIVPGLVLVPMLAFDRAGWRLGYGGGFYDRTLALLRGGGAAVAVGVAFAAQEVEAVPHDPLDQRLDWIVTEREAIRIG